MRGNAFDAANGTAAISFVASYLAGFNWPTIAAFLAAVYSLMIIGEKAVGWVRKLRARRSA